MYKQAIRCYRLQKLRLATEYYRYINAKSIQNILDQALFWLKTAKQNSNTELQNTIHRIHSSISCMLFK